MAYTAYVLTDATRSRLMLQFGASFPEVIAHHITVKFGVPKDTPVPDDALVKVVGHASSDSGIQALVCSVNGSTIRPDGGTYHITWSLDPAKHKPVDSNMLLQRGQWIVFNHPITIDVVPSTLN